MASSSSKLVLITALLSIAALSMPSAQATSLAGSIVSGVISCPISIVDGVCHAATSIVAGATVNLVDTADKIIATAVTNPTGAFSIVLSGTQAIADTTLVNLKVILPTSTACGLVNTVVEVPLTIVSTVTGSVLTTALGLVNGLLGSLLGSVSLGNINFITTGLLPF